MGLSNFETQGEGVIPMLVMNTIKSVALFKNTLRSVLQVVGLFVGATVDQRFEEEYSGDSSRPRRLSITLYGLLCKKRCVGGSDVVECSVCLCGFRVDEEVSELSCKHFFHKTCLDKWFDNHHISCPICRSIM